MPAVGADAHRKSKKKKRRQKKRRTKDFSDSSDSSEEETPVREDQAAQAAQAARQAAGDVQDADGDVVLSEDELEGDVVLFEDELEGASELQSNLHSAEVLARLPLTKTVLNRDFKNVSKAAVASELDTRDKQLKNSYLGLMFENYGNDIDKIREAADFNERSLSVLANVLKSGANIFDYSTLQAVASEST